MTERIAALDAGTNTFRLYIAEVGVDGTLHELVRTVAFAGLGQGVDTTGRFDPEAIARAMAILDEYVAVMRSHKVSRVRMVATSAARDAENRADLFDAVRQRLGSGAEVVSGTEEAALSFAGAVCGAQINASPVLVMDSGGGSTELVLGSAGGEVISSVSLDVGSRRIRERYLHDDPPVIEQVDAARAEVNRLLDRVNFLDGVGTFVGVAGTVTTITALVKRLHTYDRDKVHRAEITCEEIKEISDQLLALPISEIQKLGPVPPERAKVLSGGALIVGEVAKRVCLPLQACESDILDAVAASVVAGKGHTFR